MRSPVASIILPFVGALLFALETSAASAVYPASLRGTWLSEYEDQFVASERDFAINEREETIDIIEHSDHIEVRVNQGQNCTKCRIIWQHHPNVLSYKDSDPECKGVGNWDTERARGHQSAHLAQYFPRLCSALKNQTNNYYEHYLYRQLDEQETLSPPDDFPDLDALFYAEKQYRGSYAENCTFLGMNRSCVVENDICLFYGPCPSGFPWGKRLSVELRCQTLGYWNWQENGLVSRVNHSIDDGEMGEDLALMVKCHEEEFWDFDIGGSNFKGYKCFVVEGKLRYHADDVVGRKSRNLLQGNANACNGWDDKPLSYRNAFRRITLEEEFDPVEEIAKFPSWLSSQYACRSHDDQFTEDFQLNFGNTSSEMIAFNGSFNEVKWSWSLLRTITPNEDQPFFVQGILETDKQFYCFNVTKGENILYVNIGWPTNDTACSFGSVMVSAKCVDLRESEEPLSLPLNSTDGARPRNASAWYPTHLEGLWYNASSQSTVHFPFDREDTIDLWEGYDRLEVKLYRGQGCFVCRVIWLHTASVMSHRDSECGKESNFTRLCASLKKDVNGTQHYLYMDLPEEDMASPPYIPEPTTLSYQESIYQGTYAKDCNFLDMEVKQHLLWNNTTKIFLSYGYCPAGYSWGRRARVEQICSTVGFWPFGEEGKEDLMLVGKCFEQEYWDYDMEGGGYVDYRCFLIELHSKYHEHDMPGRRSRNIFQGYGNSCIGWDSRPLSFRNAFRRITLEEEFDPDEDSVAFPDWLSDKYSCQGSINDTISVHFSKVSPQMLAQNKSVGASRWHLLEVIQNEDGVIFNGISMKEDRGNGSTFHCFTVVNDISFEQIILRIGAATFFDKATACQSTSQPEVLAVVCEATAPEPEPARNFTFPTWLASPAPAPGSLYSCSMALTNVNFPLHFTSQTVVAKSPDADAADAVTWVLADVLASESSSYFLAVLRSSVEIEFRCLRVRIDAAFNDVRNISLGPATQDKETACDVAMPMDQMEAVCAYNNEIYGLNGTRPNMEEQEDGRDNNTYYEKGLNGTHLSMEQEDGNTFPAWMTWDTCLAQDFSEHSVVLLNYARLIVPEKPQDGSQVTEFQLAQTRANSYGYFAGVLQNRSKTRWDDDDDENYHCFTAVGVNRHLITLSIGEEGPLDANCAFDEPARPLLSLNCLIINRSRGTGLG